MFCIPYVMLSVTPKLRSLDPNLIDAAMDLGATPFQALTKVIVPQIKPGIVSGALIAFTMSFDTSSSRTSQRATASTTFRFWSTRCPSA